MVATDTPPLRSSITLPAVTTQSRLSPGRPPSTTRPPASGRLEVPLHLGRPQPLASATITVGVVWKGGLRLWSRTTTSRTPFSRIAMIFIIIIITSSSSSSSSSVLFPPMTSRHPCTSTRGCRSSVSLTNCIENLYVSFWQILTYKP